MKICSPVHTSAPTASRGLRPIVVSSVLLGVLLSGLASARFSSRASAQTPTETNDAAAVHVEVVVGREQPDPGDAPEPAALNTPFAIAFEPPDGDDEAAAMWIVEYDGGRLLRLEADGNLVPVAGDGTLGYAEGTAGEARFNKLHNVLRLPDGRLLMSDHLNHAIRSFDPTTGLVQSIAGSGQPGFAGDGGPYAAARFNQPICVESGTAPHLVLVADIRNRRIRQLNLEQGTVRTVVGNGEAGVPEDGADALDSPLVDPRAAIADSLGNLYVLERGGHALRQVTPAGQIVTLAGTGQAGHRDGPALQATLNGPKHLCLGPEGQIVIADDVNDAIRVYDPRTQRLRTVDLGPYRLNRPHGVAVHNQWLYIADSFNHRILRTRWLTTREVTEQSRGD